MSYLASGPKMAVWLGHSPTGSEAMSLVIKDQKQIKFGNRFLEILWDILREPNGCVTYLRMKKNKQTKNETKQNKTKQKNEKKKVK